jgi:hypothetical protein
MFKLFLITTGTHRQNRLSGVTGVASLEGVELGDRLASFIVRRQHEERRRRRRYKKIIL